MAPACAAAGALALALPLMLAPGAPAQAQSGITINNDVLNSLGPGPEAAPLAPLAPAAPPTPLSPRSAPDYEAPGGQAPAFQLQPPPAGGRGATTFQPYGDGNVVTRPGTLLFPPLEPPTSTLAPGLQDNHSARTEAMNNAFAEGPEPSSQLLIPLDDPAAPAAGSGGDGSVTVFMDNLPPADDGAAAADAPRITLRRPPMAPPQPAPRKPEVSPEMLAEVGVTTVDEPAAALAPEFQESETPEAVPLAEVETAAIEPEPEPAAAEPAPQAAALPEAPPVADSMAERDAPMQDAPLSSAAVPAPERAAESAAESAAEDATTLPAAEAPASEAAMQAAAADDGAGSDGPVSLLPPQTADSAARDDMPANDSAADASGSTAPVASAPVASAEVPAPVAAAEIPANDAAPAASGVQTASLAVGPPLQDMTVTFDSDSAELTDLVQAELRSLASSLRASEDGRIQVLGFASAKDGSQDLARKLALSRALKVRTFLIDAGVPSARIQVRSLGDQSDGGPANRVDIRPIDS